MIYFSSHAVNDKKQRFIINGMMYSFVDLFIYCADDSVLSFDEIHELIKGFTMNGLYITLKDKFEVQGLNNPFRSDFWN